MQRLQRDSTPTSPSTLLPDFDPVVERVISRCLEKNPDSRPASAISVAAALPGGDPLAAALAAGEIPSLEMVAAAGGEGRIRPVVAGLCVAAMVVGILISTFAASRTSLLAYDPMEKPPEVLRERSRQVLELVGHDLPVADAAHGFSSDEDVLRFLRPGTDSTDRWDTLRDGRPAGVYYWYRQSPGQLIPLVERRLISLDDPPPTTSGMAEVRLDTSGRLLRLSIVPILHEEEGGVAADRADPAAAPSGAPGAPGPIEPDWAPVFEAAGLNLDEFTSVEPTWVPSDWADQRLAWTGFSADDSEHELRVEAASFRGQPTQFRLFGPWSRPDRMVPPPSSMSDRVIEGVLVLIIVGMIAAVFWLGIRNVRKGVGDRAGAWRLGALTFIVSSASWLITTNHATGTSDELNMIMAAAAAFLFVACMFASFYLAIEPWVRKTWPDRIVSWTRLLTGRFRDPLVGRDVLAGGALFLAYTLVQKVGHVIGQQMGFPLAKLDVPDVQALLGANVAIAVAMSVFMTSVLNAMFFLLLLVFLRQLARREWLAIVLFVGVFMLVGAALGSGSATSRALSMLTVALIGGLWVFTMVRFGLVAFFVMFFADLMVAGFPMTFDSDAWYGGTSAFGMGIILAVAAYGLWASAPGWSTGRISGGSG